MARFSQLLFAALLVPCVSFRARHSRRKAPSGSLGDMMSIEEQMKTLTDLQAIGVSFASGFAVNGTRDRAVGYDSSAAYILERIRGFSADLQPKQIFYDDLMWTQTAASKLAAASPWEKTYTIGVDFNTMYFSGSGQFAGPIAELSGDARGCSASDWEGFPVGSAALVSRGDCTFCEKGCNAKQAGASAFLMYYLEGQKLGTPRLNCVCGENVPALSVTYDVGLELRSSPTTTISVEASGRTFEKQSSNIVLDFPGGDETAVVMVGGHLDSVPAGPGVNDDGSGSTLVLEMLRNTVQKYGTGGQLRNKLRFCWWGSEEWGLIGSRRYAASLSPEENSKIAGFLNFDMMASPNGGQFINKGSMDPKSPIGSGHIQHLFERAFESYGAPWHHSGLSGSDFLSFLEVGIPAGGLLTGASGLKSEAMAAKFGGQAGVSYDACYHQPCDTTDRVDQDRQLLMSRVGAKVAEELALDPEIRMHLTRDAGRAQVVEDAVEAGHVECDETM